MLMSPSRPLWASMNFSLLHEHAARAAARVVDAALVGREHLDEDPDDVGRRVELAALLALGARELGEEVLVDAAERVLGAVGGGAEGDVAHEVDELAEALLVEAGPGVVLGQHALERGLSRSIAVIASSTRVPIVGCGALGLEVRPSGFLRHPEDARGAVLVGVLGVGALGAVGLELGVLGLERVRDVLQEDQAQDDVLVFGGVHVVPQGVGGLPELRLEAAIGVGRFVDVDLACVLHATRILFLPVAAGTRPARWRTDVDSMGRIRPSEGVFRVAHCTYGARIRHSRGAEKGRVDRVRFDLRRPLASW